MVVTNIILKFVYDFHDTATIVGESRQAGRGTDNKSITDEDGFTLVKGKEKDRRRCVDRNVTTSGSGERESDKIVSSSLS